VESAFAFPEARGPKPEAILLAIFPYYPYLVIQPFSSGEPMPLQTGDRAPDFTLRDQNDQPVTLSGFIGKPVVLYFYPKDFTPGCTREACDFRDGHAAFHQNGAVVIGVSGDKVESHKKFADEYGLPFILLSDPDKTVMKQYGTYGMKKQYGREYEGIIRTTVLVAPDGTIAKIWAAVKVEGHSEKVLKEILNF
jgi:peroxiredoxin Q/BCP